MSLFANSYLLYFITCTMSVCLFIEPSLLSQSEWLACQHQTVHYDICRQLASRWSNAKCSLSWDITHRSFSGKGGEGEQRSGAWLPEFGFELALRRKFQLKKWKRTIKWGTCFYLTLVFLSDVGGEIYVLPRQWTFVILKLVYIQTQFRVSFSINYCKYAASHDKRKE